MTAEGSHTAPDKDPGNDPAGISAFVARVLDQLSLSAWLPSAFLTVAGGFLLQFRAQKSLSFGQASVSLTKNPAVVLILAIPVLVSATLVTQAFSFEAIRALEGYWYRPVVPAFSRNVMIRWHSYRKRSLQSRRKEASKKAFSSARLRLLENEFSRNLVDALEAEVLGIEPPPLTPTEENMLTHMSWRSRCDAWELARIDYLLMAERDYPRSSRILPTRLGNIMRATEDGLKNAGQDLEGFVLRQRNLVSDRIQQQHDQFRSRLEMYCILVFVAALLAALTLAFLLGRSIPIWKVATIAAGFITVSFSSYQAAISSARGYCTALRQMDKKAAGASKLANGNH